MLAHDNRAPHASMGATDVRVPTRGRCYPAESPAALQAPRIPVAAAARCRVGDDIGIEPNNCVSARHRQFGRSVTIGRHCNFVRRGSTHGRVRRGDRKNGGNEDERMQMHGTISYGVPRQCGCPGTLCNTWPIEGLSSADHHGRRHERHPDRRRRPSDSSFVQEAWPTVLL